MFSPTSIAGKCVQGVLGPDQAVQKGCVESKRQQGPFNTAEASRGAKAESAVRFNKPQGEVDASSVASTRSSGVEPQPLVVSDVKLEDSQSPRSSRVGTRLCRSARSVGDRLFSLAFRLLALSTVVGGAAATSDPCSEFVRDGLVRFDSASNICSRQGLPNAPGDVFRAMETFQGVPTNLWSEDAFGSGSGWFPTVIASVCEAVGNSSVLNPETWNPAQWVQSGAVITPERAQECAWALCHLLINGSGVSAGAVGYSGTSLDGRQLGCGFDFINALYPVNGSSDSVPVNGSSDSVPVNGSSDSVPVNGSSDSVGVPVDYTPVIMFGTALLVGIIQNVVLSYKAKQDVVNVIEQTENSHERQTFLGNAAERVKLFGEGQVPQFVSSALGNALGVGVAMLANYLSSAPTDWGDKPWENEAFKNMVVFVGAQLIAEGLSMVTDTCGLGYFGGTMVGKPNKGLLEKKGTSFNKRIQDIREEFPNGIFFNNPGVIERVKRLSDENVVQNPILSAGGKSEHISRVVKAMLPEIVSLGGLVAVLQVTSNDWDKKAVFGGLEYVVGSAAVNAFASKCLGTGSVRSSMALEVLDHMRGILVTTDLNSDSLEAGTANAQGDSTGPPSENSGDCLEQITCSIDQDESRSNHDQSDLDRSSTSQQSNESVQRVPETAPSTMEISSNTKP